MTKTDNSDFIICAANARALTGEEWEQVTPWGNFPNEKGLQRVTPVQGRALVAAFNAQAEKSGNSFRGVPIYIGHPDVDPRVYTDHRRIGKIKDLSVRADGLYALVAWNDLGTKNKEEGYAVYPSAVWAFKRVGGGVIEPFELVSVGMTNVPVIKGVAPWSANSAQAEQVNELALCDAVAVMGIAGPGESTRRAGAAEGHQIARGAVASPGGASQGPQGRGAGRAGPG